MNKGQATGDRLYDRLGLVFTVFAVLWFGRDLLIDDAVPFFRDLSTYFYPLRFTLFESYRTGKLPLWNRHMATGFPVLADLQSGAFYPPHFLFFFIPFFTALRIIFIVHFAVAALGAYKLFRYWKFPVYLSVLAGCLFTFGGTLVSLTNLLNHFQTAVWLPWVILLWEKLLRAPVWKHFVAFVLLLAVQFLAGSPEIWAMSLFLVLLDGMRRKEQGLDLSYGRMLSVWIVATLVVLLLVMAQLLPTTELFLQSRRQQAIPVQETLYWSLHPANLIGIFLPDKEIDSSASLGVRFFFVRDAPFFISYYLGAISAFGVVLWLAFSPIRKKLILLGFLAASLLVALGSYTPVYPFLLRHISFLNAFRFPEKFFFFSYALILYVTVTGIADLVSRNETNFRRALVALGSVCAVWLGLYVFVRLNPGPLARFMAAQTGYPLSSPDLTKMFAAALTNLERQVVLSFGFALLLLVGKTKSLRPALFGTLMVSAVFVDLAWAHRGFLFTLKPKFVFSGPRVLQEPDSDRKRLFYYPSQRNLHPSFFFVRAQPRFDETTALFSSNLLPNEGIFQGFDYFQEIDALARQPYTDFLTFANGLDPREQVKLLAIFNVGYVVSFHALNVDGMTLVDHFPRLFSWLYRIDGVVPRVYIVNKAIVEKNPTPIFRRFISPGFNPMEEVILNAEAGIKPRGALAATAKIVHYEHQRVTIRASLNDEGILVLTDSYYPGWKAFVDGREVPIFRANHLFRAVRLRPGEHAVEFRYEPMSFKIGVLVSVATALCLAAFPGVRSFKAPKLAQSP